MLSAPNNRESILGERDVNADGLLPGFPLLSLLLSLQSRRALRPLFHRRFLHLRFAIRQIEQFLSHVV